MNNLSRDVSYCDVYLYNIFYTEFENNIVKKKKLEKKTLQRNSAGQFSLLGLSQRRMFITN